MWLAGALIGLVIAVLAHAGISRVLTSLNLNMVVRFMIAAGIVGACLVGWLLDRYGVSAPQSWAAVLVYAFGCELYVFLFTLAMSSVTANLLTNLSRRDMTDMDIGQFFDSRQMVAARLDRLVAAGLLDEGPTGLALTPKGARTVRTFGWLRGFFRHPLPALDIVAND
jgi:uncharacterized membrane protein YeaQ/YmgE (transglycosylase-associated protein family)